VRGGVIGVPYSSFDVGEQFRMGAAENGEEEQPNSKKAVTLVML
jgi:hypothetical protein